MSGNGVPIQQRISTERAKELARLAAARSGGVGHTFGGAPVLPSTSNPLASTFNAGRSKPQASHAGGYDVSVSSRQQLQQERHSRRSLTFTAAGHDEMTQSLAPMLGLQSVPVVWERLAKRQSFFESSRGASGSGEAPHGTLTDPSDVRHSQSSSGLTLRALRKHLDRLGGEVSQIHLGKCYICSEWGRVARRTCCAATRHHECESEWQRQNRDKWTLVARFPAPPLRVLQIQERLAAKRNGMSASASAPRLPPQDPTDPDAQRSSSTGHLPQETRQRAGSIAEVIAARAALRGGEGPTDVALRGWQYKKLPLLDSDSAYVGMLRRLHKEGVTLFQVLPCSLCKEPWLVVPARGDFRPLLPSEIALMQDERDVDAQRSYVEGERLDNACSDRVSRWTGISSCGQLWCSLMGWVLLVWAPMALIAILALDGAGLDTSSSGGILIAAVCGLCFALVVYVVYRLMVLSATNEIVLCPCCLPSGDESLEPGGRQGRGGRAGTGLDEEDDAPTTPASPALVEELERIGDEEARRREGDLDMGLHYGDPEAVRQRDEKGHLPRTMRVHKPQAKRILSPLYQAQAGPAIPHIEEEFEGSGMTGGDQGGDDEDRPDEEPDMSYSGNDQDRSGSSPRSATRSVRTGGSGRTTVRNGVVAGEPEIGFESDAIGGARRGQRQRIVSDSSLGSQGPNVTPSPRSARGAAGGMVDLNLADGMRASPLRQNRQRIESDSSMGSNAPRAARTSRARPPPLQRIASERAMRRRSRTLSMSKGIKITPN